jgi:hypothetical protein
MLVGMAWRKDCIFVEPLVQGSQLFFIKFDQTSTLFVWVVHHFLDRRILDSYSANEFRVHGSMLGSARKTRQENYVATEVAGTIY